MAPRVVKKVVHAGKPPFPNFCYGAKVIFDYEARLLPEATNDSDNSPSQNGELELIEDTRLQWPKGYGMPLEIVLGKKFQMPVWEECLKTMMVDEISSFDVQVGDLTPYPMVSKKLRDIAKQRLLKEQGHPPEESHCHSSCFGMAAQFGLGYEVLDRLVERRQPVRFTFHLHKVLQPEDYEADSWQLSSGQKLDSVPELKDRGNMNFKKGNWSDAERFYQEALQRLENLQLMEKPGEPEWVELDKARVPLLSNLCQCQLKRESYYEASETGTEILKRDPLNEKALYRRAKAKMGQWDLDGALMDLELLGKSYPNSRNLVSKEMAVIEGLRKQKTNEERSQYKAMFVS